MKKRKLAFLHILPLLSGPQQNMLNMLPYLQDYELHIVAGDSGDLAEKAQAMGAHFHVLPHLRREIGWHDWHAAQELYDFLRTEQIDILHTMASKAGFLGRIVGRWAKTPLVIHHVQAFPHYHVDARWKQQLLLGLEWLAGRCKSVVVCVNQEEARLAHTWKLASPDNIHVIHPGFLFPDLSSFSDFPKNKGVTTVGFCGRFAYAKAPEYFVEIAHLACQQRDDLRFLMVGDGELRSLVEAKIDQYQLNSKFKLAGWQADVYAGFAQMDVLLQPSRWESFGLVFGEAAFCGVPSIAPNVLGTSEIIQHGKTGWLTASNDPQEMAQMLLQVVSTPDQLKSTGLRARSFVMENFTAEKQAQAFQKIYRESMS